MANPKKAAILLKQINIIPREQFIAEAFDATGDERLLKPNLTPFDKRSLAINSLIQTAQSAGGIQAVDLLPDYRIDNHYNILEIDKSANQEDIKSAYEKKVKELKDKLSNGNLSENELNNLNTQYNQIRDAYIILGDEESKVKYDNLTQQLDLIETEKGEQLYIVKETKNTQYKNIYKEAKNKRLILEEQDETRIAFQDPDSQIIEIPDYYLLLGVPKNATPSEIQLAYSGKLSQLSLEMEGKTFDDQELHQFNQRYSELREANAILNNSEIRNQYDNTINNITPVIRTDGTRFYPYKITQQEEISGYIRTEFIPTQISKSEQNSALKNTQDFRQSVINAGFITLSEDQLNNLRTQTGINNLTNEHYNAGLRLFVNGGEGISEQYRDSIKELKLNPQLQIELLKPAEVARYLELGNENLARDLRISAGNPELKLSKIADLSSLAKDTNLIIGTKNNKLSLLKQFLRPNKNMSSFQLSRTSEKVTNFTNNLISSGASKVKTAAKGKFRQAAIKLLGNVAGLFTGGIGKVVAYISSFALPWLKRNLHKIGATILGAGLLLGSAPLALGGGVITVFGIAGTGGTIAGTTAAYFSTFLAFFTQAATGYLGWIFGGVGAFSLLVIIIVYIINVSAYVVPYAQLTNQQGIAEDSIYLDSQKTPSPKSVYDNDELPFQVTYTIILQATSESLSDVTFDYNCNAINKDGTFPCPETNPTEEEIEALAPAVIDTGPEITITYTQNFDNSFVDSVITDTLTITGRLQNGTIARETVAASILIGNPPTGCITFDETFNNFPAAKAALVQAASYLSSTYPAFMARVCAEGPIMQCYSTNDAAANCDKCWGQHLHGSCDIQWYNSNQWSGSFESSTFIAAHEWMHHVQKINPTLQSQYVNYCSSSIPGPNNCIINEGRICSYPLWANIEDNNQVENLAEATGAYIFLPRLWEDRCGPGTSLQSLYPVHTEFINLFVMH